MVALARLQDAGPVNYRWPKPGASEPVAKTSYIQLFKPWGWIIGSGVYIDDVQAEFARQLRDASLVGVGIALLMALVVLLIARSIARPLQEAVQAMGNIASGESDLTRRLDTHGRDEITHLGEHFNRFNGKLQGVVASCRAPPTHWPNPPGMWVTMRVPHNSTVPSNRYRWTKWPLP